MKVEDWIGIGACVVVGAYLVACTVGLLIYLVRRYRT